MNVKDFPVVKEVASTLSKLYGGRLSKIFLYGSFARGEQQNESDIDFFITLKDQNVSPYNEIDFYSKDISRLSDKYKVEISVKAGNDGFIKNDNNLLARFIRKEGIIIS